MGWIYCIHNAMFGEGIYKLGCAKDIKKRVNSYTTSYIEPVRVMHIVEIEDYMRVEKMMFKILERYRIKARREFFKCEIGEIKDVMDSIVKIKSDEGRYENSERVTVHEKKVRIIQSEDITDEKYAELVMRMRKGGVNNIENYQMKKYVYKKKFCIKEITKEFLDKYYEKEYVIENHTGLIDKRNIRTGETAIKNCEIVNKMISTIGYKHCYDVIKIGAESFKANMENANKYVKEYYKMNNMKVEIGETLKGQMGNVNKILHKYGIDVKIKQRRKKVNKKVVCINEYIIDRMNNINIYAGNRKRNNGTFYDENNLVQIN